MSLNIAKLQQSIIFRQFVKFCLVGIINTAIDYLVYFGLTRGLDLYFLYANIIAILVAMTFSFIFNKYWTFRDYQKNIKKQYSKFFLVNIVYFLLNNMIVFSLVKYLLIFDLLAKIIAIFIGLIWNFTANRHWTFKRT
jgi:putative flippase GtrA